MGNLPEIDPSPKSVDPTAVKPDLLHQLAANLLPHFGAVLPHVLWALVVIFALLFFGASTRRLLEGATLSKVGLGPIELRFAEQAAANIRGPGAPKTPREFKPIADRAKLLSEHLHGAYVLWVDDNHPSQNVQERRVLEAFGIRFDLASSTDEAMKWLERAHYDAIISDLNRPAEKEINDSTCGSSSEPVGAGCALAKRVTALYGSSAPPLILYTASYPKAAGTPANVFGVSDRVDQMFNLVLDALSRRTTQDTLQ